MRRRARERRTALLFLAPSLAGVLVFVLIPFGAVSYTHLDSLENRLRVFSVAESRRSR